MAHLFVQPRVVALSTLNVPVSGAQAYFYDATTNNPRTTYTTAALAVEQASPVVASASGVFAPIFLDPAEGPYKVDIKNPITNTSLPGYPIDNIEALPSIRLPKIQDETDEGATIADYTQDYGVPERYALNLVPGTTDMTAAINMAADVVRASSGKYKLRLIGPYYATGSIDFDLIRVEGPGADMGPAITFGPTNSEYNCLIGRQSFSWANFRIDCSWDQVTTGLDGDAIHIENSAGSGFAYNCHLHNITVQKACRSLIFWRKGGYGSIYNFHGNSAGGDPLVFEGNGGAESFTTVWVGGQSIFSDAVNGYVKLTDCIAVSFDSVISENTLGIELNGADNRSISFNNFYQENHDIAAGNYLTVGTSAGIGLSITNSFGGLKTIPDLTNWQGVSFSGNSLLTEPPIPLAPYFSDAGNVEGTTSTTGGVTVTATSISLGAGVWEIDGTAQTVAATGTPNLTDAGMVITTGASDSGFTTATTTDLLVKGSDRKTYSHANGAVRLNARRRLRLTATTTVYLRLGLNFAAGSVAYNGALECQLIKSA